MGLGLWPAKGTEPVGPAMGPIVSADGQKSRQIGVEFNLEILILNWNRCLGFMDGKIIELFFNEINITD